MNGKTQKEKDNIFNQETVTRAKIALLYRVSGKKRNTESRLKTAF